MIMLNQTQSFYSLLIPLIIISIGISIVIFNLFKQLPDYLKTYSYALICVGISFFLHTVLNHDILIPSMASVILLFFISCSLHIHAIHQCLKLNTNWQLLSIALSLGTLGIFYFSIIDNQQKIRIVIIGTISTFIYLHHFKLLWHSKKLNPINQGLIYLCFILVFILLSRALAIYFLVDIPEVVSSSQMIWALTQLMMICIDLGFLAFFIAAAFEEKILTLRHEVNLDPLTGLLNRRGLQEYLIHLNPNSQTIHAILLCDLDHFKQINDRCGHHIGDLALKHVSSIMAQPLSGTDQIFRIGGEEFLIILHDTTPVHCLEIAEKIRHDIEHIPLIYQHQQIKLSTSIGISYFTNFNDFHSASQYADDLLYQAKKLGRNNIQSILNTLH